MGMADWTLRHLRLYVYDGQLWFENEWAIPFFYDLSKFLSYIIK